MNKWLKSFLQVVLPFSLGILLVWLVFKDQDLNEIVADLKTANWFWISMSIVAAILANYSRAIRWNMLISSLGYQPSTFRVFAGVQVGYIANLAFPRMGELARCWVLKKTDQIPITQLVGTVIVERTIDLVTMLIVMGSVILFNLKLLGGLITDMLNQKNSQEKTPGFLESYGIFIVLALFIFAGILLFLYKKQIGRSKFGKKIIVLAKGLIAGFQTIKSIKKVNWFIFHSIFIWLMYFLMVYFCMLSLPFTSHLTINDGFLLMVAGGLGIIAPVQGGIGAYHYMINATLNLIDPLIGDAKGLSFATLSHGIQMVVIIILGLMALLFVFLYRPKIRKEVNA